MAVTLLVKTEDGQVTEIPVLNKVILGRSGNSTHQIADGKMSGSHGSFEMDNSGHLIFTDLGSTNGSYLNNSAVTKTMVKINDIIQIGNTLIKINEKQLTANERLSIGTSAIKSVKDLPKEIPDSAEGAPKKKIVLNQNIKTKKPVASNWANAENVLEQEATTGNTRFLKLDSTKKKKP